jgi:hypothetical protein
MRFSVIFALVFPVWRTLWLGQGGDGGQQARPCGNEQIKLLLYAIIQIIVCNLSHPQTNHKKELQ